MENLAYDSIAAAFKVVTRIFFREIRTTGTHFVPKDDPCIFIVAPHANQFIDPGMVLISSPRRFSPLMAESSFSMKIVGQCARLLKAIPVPRPQDMSSQGIGLLTTKDDETRVFGIDTKFEQQVAPRDLLAIGKSIRLEVLRVVSDTEIVLKKPMDPQTILALSQKPESFKVIPHVDQSVLYERVQERLARSESIVIFPEGGSHDRSEMLPLKAGFAIMALGAVAAHQDLNVKIVPVGLNYFHPHRFRSRAVVSYGTPISVKREWVEMYKQGGPAKREAISALLDAGCNGLKSVTVNAPNYDTLMIIAAARRLYRPAAEHKLRIDQVVELNRRFLLGYKYYKDDPKLKELAHKVQAYNDTLKYFGLRDHQVERTRTTPFSAAPVLVSRFIRLIFLAVFGFPSIVLNAPVSLLALTISQKKQQKALAGSTVKLAARDVLATWKVLVALVFAPTLYGIYSCLLFLYLLINEYPNQSLQTIFFLSFLSWIAQPFIHYAGVRFVETGFELLWSIKSLVFALTDPDAARQLRMMREHLSRDITAFVNENGPAALPDFDPERFQALPTKEKENSRNLRGLFSNVELVKNWLSEDKLLFNFATDNTPSPKEDDSA